MIFAIALGWFHLQLKNSIMSAVCQVRFCQIKFSQKVKLAREIN